MTLSITTHYKIWNDEDGFYHRINGPALIGYNGDKHWYVHGKCHRLDGPAREIDNQKQWFYKGDLIDCNTQEEFERIIKLKLLW